MMHQYAISLLHSVARQIGLSKVFAEQLTRRCPGFWRCHERSWLDSQLLRLPRKTSSLILRLNGNDLYRPVLSAGGYSILAYCSR